MYNNFYHLQEILFDVHPITFYNHDTHEHHLNQDNQYYQLFQTMMVY